MDKRDIYQASAILLAGYLSGKPRTVYEGLREKDLRDFVTIAQGLSSICDRKIKPSGETE